MALYLKMFVRSYSIIVPNFKFVSQSAQFGQNFTPTTPTRTVGYCFITPLCYSSRLFPAIRLCFSTTPAGEILTHINRSTINRCLLQSVLHVTSYFTLSPKDHRDKRSSLSHNSILSLAFYGRAWRWERAKKMEWGYSATLDGSLLCNNNHSWACKLYIKATRRVVNMIRQDLRKDTAEKGPFSFPICYIMYYMKPP